MILPESMQDGPRICAVSYLNTSPLVWGLLHGPQRGAAQLSFAVPSECARRVVEGGADLGIVPVVEMDRHGLTPVSELCIACRGEVRSILLFARRPWTEVRTLAADMGSRTSVQLARIVLRERYGADPQVRAMAPDLRGMLESADAALLIGDAALAVNPGESGLPWIDLGQAWLELTGLPMVFAVWAGRAPLAARRVEELLEASFSYGLENLESIIKIESAARGFPRELVARYFERNVTWRLGREERAGLERFLAAARALQGSQAEGLAHDDAEGSRRAVPQR
ncbi:MAG: menaquinone biosynthesis protein [Bryobacteraceae bacterium]|nr:menaquinone biosynthesis protein [Bryobacteraceae bacterium]